MQLSTQQTHQNGKKLNMRKNENKGNIDVKFILLKLLFPRKY